MEVPPEIMMTLTFYMDENADRNDDGSACGNYDVYDAHRNDNENADGND